MLCSSRKVENAMTLITPRAVGAGRRPGSLDHLLERGLQSLDITPAEFDLVERRYTALGGHLESHWEESRSSNEVYPQGSFRLGTVTRRFHHDDDIDIDLVAKRGLARSSTTQEELKKDVGRAVSAFAADTTPTPNVHEDDRCWTLQFPGMHMDVLPALTDEDADQGILITDRAVRVWQTSNPRGYAHWFDQQIADELRLAHEELAKNTDVEEIPEALVRSELQRIVQALKRHRDVYFTGRLDERPSSVIITTLAALAYPTAGRGNLYDTLRAVTRNMPEGLRYEGATWVLPNPAQTGENFADYWNTEPDRARNFENWMDAVQQDFDALGQSTGLHNTLPQFGHKFGQRVQDAATAAAGGTMFDARKNGGLQVKTNSASTPARTVRDHGFYGSSR